MSTLRLSLVGLGLRVATTLIVVINTLFLARLLGPGAFGEYILFFRLVSVLAAFADFGLPQSVNAFYGRHAQWRASIHRVILGVIPLVWLIVTVGGGTTLWLARDFLLPHIMPMLIVTAFGVLPLSIYANIWNGMMIGAGRIWRVNLIQFIMCLLSLVLTLVFVLALGGGIVSAALSYTGVMLVQFLVMLIMAMREPEEHPVEAPPELSRDMLNFGIRGYVGSLSYLLWTRLPVFILNITHGPNAVGIFSLGQQVLEKLLLPVQAIRDVIYQKMSVLSPPSAAPALNRYLRLTGWGMLGVSILGILLTRVLLITLLGQQYSEAVEVARIMLGGAVLVAVSLLLDAFFLNSLHRPGLVSIFAWFRFFVGFILSLIFIPRYGAVGAAVAIVLTQIVSTAVYAIMYMRMTKTSARDLFLIRLEDINELRFQVASLLRLRISQFKETEST